MIALKWVWFRFTNLGSEVFKDSAEVDRGARSDTLSISAGFEKPGDSANWELKTGFLGPGD